MTRRSREDVPRGWFHVFVRGAGGRTIFADDVARGIFIRHLEAQVVAGRLVVFAFVLMTNHFHLLVMSPTGELAIAMRELLRPFVLLVNPRLKRDGPLFRSRYGSKPVKTHSYRTCVLYYIDRNPKAAGMVERSVDYPHGSAFHFHRGTTPSWLDGSWAEQVLRESRGIEGLPKGAYGVGRVTQHDVESDQLIEARMRAIGTLDPLAVQLDTEEERVLFLSRYLPSQSPGPGFCHQLPTAAARTIKRVSGDLDLLEGVWSQRDPETLLHWKEVAVMGLMRRMTGMPDVEIGGDLSVSRGIVRRRFEEHERLLRSDSDYRAMVHGLASEILWG